MWRPLRGIADPLKMRSAGSGRLEKEDLSIRTRIRSRLEERAKIQDELARVASDLEALGESKKEFQSLASCESGFEALRGRFEASKERNFGFQAFKSREAQMRTRMGEEQENLGRLMEEDNGLCLDEERLEALGPSIDRRAGAQARLAELGRLEEQYRNLVAGIAKRDEALSEAARRGVRAPFTNREDSGSPGPAHGFGWAISCTGVLHRGSSRCPEHPPSGTHTPHRWQFRHPGLGSPGAGETGRGFWQPWKPGVSTATAPCAVSRWVPATVRL